MSTIAYRNRILAVASLGCGLLAVAPARAGTYEKVNQSDWWAGITGLPSYVNMYIFRPTTMASKPPIVVVPHHCQGTASSSHSESSGLESIADKNGFIIIYPEATGQNCWDAGSDRSLNHDGKGDVPAVAQMVKYTLSKYSGDAGRVYSVGGSSGGIMTEALLGVFPDVFMGGVSLMGVPCGCWAEQYHDVTGKPSDGTGQWSSPCAGGTVTKTAQQWGDLVRSYFPGYTGHRPRLQHWHGTSDTTLNYKNMAEDIKEWTNLLGLSEAPTGTEQNTPKSGTTHQYWKNSCYTVYETFSMSGVGHAVPFDANAVAAYFGVDKAGGQDPETAACPGAVPGGTGGAGGAGGTTGSGGATGAGGTGGTRDGGPDARDGGSGGVQQTGGRSGSGGAIGGGGSAGGNGGSGSGGKVGGAGGGGVGGTGVGGNSVGGSGGNAAGGGATGSGGSAGSGGTSASGGATASGGSLGSGGRGGDGSGGAAGQGGSAGSGGSPPMIETPANGCNCAIGGHARHEAVAAMALLLVAFASIVRRKRRPQG